MHPHSIQRPSRSLRHAAPSPLDLWASPRPIQPEAPVSSIRRCWRLVIFIIAAAGVVAVVAWLCNTSIREKYAQWTISLAAAVGEIDIR